MRSHLFRAIVVAVLWGSTMPAVEGQMPRMPQMPQMPRWLGGGKATTFQVFRAPGDRFTLEYPKSDWQPLPGAGSVFVIFSQKKAEASVALEHTLLNQALGPADITQLFADLELEQLQARYRGAQGSRAALNLDTQGRPVVVIDFKRTGISGEERVRQYSLPLGTDLFRLICSGKPATFDKHIPVFERMASSFKNGSLASTLEPPPPTRVATPAPPPAAILPAPAADANTVVSPADGALHLASNPHVTPPTKIRHVEPIYPDGALKARIIGTVKIELRIGADGNVEHARVVQRVPLLDEAAMHAVKQWKFIPTLLRGQPVPVVIIVTFNFDYRNSGHQGTAAEHP